MRLAVSILGTEVFSVEISRHSSTQSLVDAIAELAGDDEEECQGIGGGATHSFERDPNPLSPDDRYPAWEDRFGFS